MIEIIPAVMPQSFEDLSHKIGTVSPYTKLVQIDVMDGKFVRSRSWPYFSSDRKSFDSLLHEDLGLPYWDEVDFEIDLMVAKPEEVVEDWIVAGASRLIIHIESTKNMPDVISQIAGRAEIGIALSPNTPIDDVLPFLEDVQFVQFMGIDTIGLQGQPFDERVVDKIREFHNAHPEIVISIDGGVTLENGHLLKEAGVSRFVSGSAIFESGDPGQVIDDFKNLF